jgi:hypothetical protein
MARNATPKQQEHSRQAAKKHGAYAIHERGKAAMTGEQLSAHAVIMQQLADRQGAIDALREHTANTLLITKIVEGYISSKTKAGCPLENIPILKILPAFMNTATRAVALLLLYTDEDEANRFITGFIEVDDEEDEDKATN